MKLFEKALRLENDGRPPVWFMRQAGRYHKHYQDIRSRHSFEEICKIPTVAADATLGPIEDFGFDAAILFSDILFPLEAVGMPLSFNPAPQLGWLIRDQETCARLNPAVDLQSYFTFQYQALELIRKRLPKETALLGFVGAPLTLLTFAIEGTHRKGVDHTQTALHKDLAGSLWQKLKPAVLASMDLQARAGIDALCIFDSCAGDFPLQTYSEKAIPLLKNLLDEFSEAHPQTKIIYYAKGLSYPAWEQLHHLNIAGLGVDWRTPLSGVLDRYAKRWAIQGNFDPQDMLKPKMEFEKILVSYFKGLAALPAEMRAGWICGLGHGILPSTPEENVKLFLRLQKEMF